MSAATDELIKPVELANNEIKTLYGAGAPHVKVVLGARELGSAGETRRNRVGSEQVLVPDAIMSDVDGDSGVVGRPKLKRRLGSDGDQDIERLTTDNNKLQVLNNDLQHLIRKLVSKEHLTQEETTFVQSLMQQQQQQAQVAQTGHPKNMQFDD